MGNAGVSKHDGATMADWLSLHGLSKALCNAILAAAPDGPTNAPEPQVDHAIKTEPNAVWRDIARAVQAKLPAASSTIDATLAQTRTNFAPDPARFPRAFTLQDLPNQPFVSCPCKGDISDLVPLAHEFGHALQLIASEERALPPVLRETCAFLCEHWYLVHLQATRPDIAAVLAPVWQSQSDKALRRSAQRLAHALAFPRAAYSYQWNYPLARILAQRLATAPDAAVLWPLFMARRTLPDIARAVQLD